METCGASVNYRRRLHTPGIERHAATCATVDKDTSLAGRHTTDHVIRDVYCNSTQS